MRNYRAYWRSAAAGGIALIALGPGMMNAPPGAINPGFSAPASMHQAHAPMIHVYGHDGRPLRGPHNESTSTNWSGYALSTGTYTSAASSWTVPTVSFVNYSSHPSFEDSSTWIGIGGFNTSDLIQLGTEQYVSSSGVTTYQPWYEILPASETVLPSQYTISPGDAISASLTCTSNCTAESTKTTWTLSMTDSTKGWTWTMNLTYKSSLSSVEWIEEAPTFSGIVALPNYGSVQFADATANGTNPNLSLSTDGIILDDQAGGNSTPCAAVDGNQFVVDYGTSCLSVPVNLVDGHDFNGDGKSDILWRDPAGDVGIWLMNGASIAQTSVLGNVPTNWAVVGQRSFTGTADADILWRDTAGDVGMWLMNGLQIKSTAVVGNMSTAWSIVGTGDFNGDGKADILWLDTAGDVEIWFMSGATIMESAVVGNMSTGWSVAGSDMKGDIFWRNTATGEVEMWVMNGTQIAQEVDFGVVSLAWSIAGIGDFDGNGSEDILWRNSDGDVEIWLMSGTQILSMTDLGNVGLNWSIVQTGDYSGAGRSDVLWMDNVGNVAAWFMNGTTISSVTIYGDVGTAWSVQSLNAD